MKIVINTCFGGFSVSKKVMKEMGWDSPYDCEDRTDPKLIEIVERLGDEANGEYADLVIVDIPEEATDWHLDNYDGSESIVYVVDGKLFWV